MQRNFCNHSERPLSFCLLSAVTPPVLLDQKVARAPGCIPIVLFSLFIVQVLLLLYLILLFFLIHSILNERAIIIALMTYKMLINICGVELLLPAGGEFPGRIRTHDNGMCRVRQALTRHCIESLISSRTSIHHSLVGELVSRLRHFLSRVRILFGGGGEVSCFEMTLCFYF